MKFPAAPPCHALLFALACGLSVGAHARPQAGREISCSPSVVRPGDSLTIATRNPLPELGLSSPDKRTSYFSLVNDFDPSAVMHSRDFMRQRRLVLPVASAAMKSGEKLFTRPGVYQFSASTNLETDDGTPRHTCRVTYQTR